MDSTINLLSRGLDGALSRQKALSNNIANVDTPNYKRKDVDFITVLRNQTQEIGNTSLSLRTTNDGHKVGSDKKNRPNMNLLHNDTSYRNDKNNVDIDVEMAEIAKNGIYYNTLSRQINEEFKILKDVISKGGR